MPGTNDIVNKRYKVINTISEKNFSEGFQYNRIFEVEDLRVSSLLIRASSFFKKRTVKILKHLNLDEEVLDKAQRDKANNCLKNEIENLQELNHPSIVRYFDHFPKGNESSRNMLYLVMEKIEGKTLDEWVSDRDSLLPEKIVLDWLVQLIDVLDYLHNHKKIIHLDIKPQNIIINCNGELKLIDFGSSQRYDSTEYPEKLLQAKRKKSIGKNPVSYIFSPSEQIAGNPIPRSDFYAIGMTLISLIVGGKLENLRRRISHRGVDWKDYYANYNDELIRLLNKMASWEYERRPANIQEIKEEIRYIEQRFYQRSFFYGWWPRISYSVPLSLTITALVIGLRFLGALQSLELQFYDHTLWMRSYLVNLFPNNILPEYYQPDPNIAIIAVWDSDMIEGDGINDIEFQRRYHRANGYPPLPEDHLNASISKEVLIDLIEKVQSYQPLTIGVDLIAPYLGDLKQTENIIAVCSYGMGDKYKNAYPAGFSSDNLGAVDVHKDISIFESEFKENINLPVRRQQILQLDEPHCPTSRSLAYQILVRYANAKQWMVEENEDQPVVNGYHYPKLKVDDFLYAKPLHPKGEPDSVLHEVLINYRTYKEVTQTILSIQDVLGNSSPSQLSDEEMDKIFKGRVVLIGSFLEEFKDRHKTPYGMQPGVILQAHKISHLIDTSAGTRRDLSYWSITESIPWIIVWSISYGLVIYSCRRIKYIYLSFVSASGLLYVVCMVGIFNAWCFPLVPIIVTYLADSTIVIKFPKTSIKRWRFSRV